MNLPRNIQKFCKKCGKDIRGGRHHTLCDDCWNKLHIVKNVKVIHSKRYLQSQVNKFKHDNRKLSDKIKNQKTLLDNQTNTIKRQSGIIENQRKTIDMLSKDNKLCSCGNKGMTLREISNMDIKIFERIPIKEVIKKLYEQGFKEDDIFCEECIEK